MHEQLDPQKTKSSNEAGATIIHYVALPGYTISSKTLCRNAKAPDEQDNNSDERGCQDWFGLGRWYLHPQATKENGDEEVAYISQQRVK